MSQSEFSNRGNSKFNGAQRSSLWAIPQRSLIFRKDASKVAAKLFFKDNLKKTLNLARTQRNERTKRIKPDRYRHAKISRKNSYAPNVIRPKTNSYADYPASRKFI
jgi:hypothetical protein